MAGERIEGAQKMVHLSFRASIKGPLTSPESTFHYLTVLSMPQVSFEFL